jgi:hypothetical protein
MIDDKDDNSEEVQIHKEIYFDLGPHSRKMAPLKHKEIGRIMRKT